MLYPWGGVNPLYRATRSTTPLFYPLTPPGRKEMAFQYNGQRTTLLQHALEGKAAGKTIQLCLRVPTNPTP